MKVLLLSFEARAEADREKANLQLAKAHRGGTVLLKTLKAAGLSITRSELVVRDSNPGSHVPDQKTVLRLEPPGEPAPEPGEGKGALVREVSNKPTLPGPHKASDPAAEKPTPSVKGK